MKMCFILLLDRPVEIDISFCIIQHSIWISTPITTDIPLTSFQQ